MNLNSFRYFIEVANTLSFTKASQNLFISQPGISQQINLLEEQLGIKLLHRTTKIVELTEEGKYLYEKLYPSFSEIEKTVSNLLESNTFPTLIKIVAVPSAASLYLPKVLKEIHEIHPEIEFSIKETTSSNVLKNKYFGNWLNHLIECLFNIDYFSPSGFYGDNALAYSLNCLMTR